MLRVIFELGEEAASGCAASAASQTRGLLSFWSSAAHCSRGWSASPRTLSEMLTCAAVKKYLSKIRNNNMRNDAVRGANNRIGKKIAEDSLEAVFELQNVFAEIEERLKRQGKQ